jgi:hypothetical protein
LQRLLTTVTLVGLLVATAAAFAITERLKLTKSPLMPGTKVSKTFSPTCGCARGRANIVIKLRRADAITVKVLGANRQLVRLLVADTFTHRGFSTFRWDGRTDLGTRAPDGTYQAEVHLAQQHQTILLPNKIQLDTTAPVVHDATANREEFSPDGDKQADFVRIKYQLSKPAHLQLYLDGHRILNTFQHTAPAASHGTARRTGDSSRANTRWSLSDRFPGQQHSGQALAPAAANPLHPARESKIHARGNALRDRFDRREALSWQLGKRRARVAPRSRLLPPTGRALHVDRGEHGHLNRAAVFVR